MQFFERVRALPVIRAVNAFINSKYMLIVLALLTVLANVFALELLAYIVVSLLGLYLCLFGKDMLVLAPIFIFVYISPSVANHPFMNENSIFFPENGLWLMLLVLVLFFVLFFLRIGTDGGFIRFFTVKRKFLLGFLILGAAFFLGGLGYEGYEKNNLQYSLLLFVSLFLLYFILTATVSWKDVPKDYFAWMGLFIGITVAIELIGVYLLHAEKIFV
ncbi:MAG: hypothetical protein IJY26_02070, partial [Clostridia bacterium]|nr:hypothetical protein [Clostridia bacterium]